MSKPIKIFASNLPEEDYDLVKSQLRKRPEAIQLIRLTTGDDNKNPSVRVESECGDDEPQDIDALFQSLDNMNCGSEGSEPVVEKPAQEESE